MEAIGSWWESLQRQEKHIQAKVSFYLKAVDNMIIQSSNRNLFLIMYWWYIHPQY
jgi:hypothetical protein